MQNGKRLKLLEATIKNGRLVLKKNQIDDLVDLVPPKPLSKRIVATALDFIEFAFFLFWAPNWWLRLRSRLGCKVAFE